MIEFPLPWKLTDTQLARPGVAAMLGLLLLEKEHWWSTKFLALSTRTTCGTIQFFGPASAAA
jgi:hypothetical protein